MSISFYFYLFLIAVLSVVVSLGGSRWIERLYRKNKDILTFPDDVVSRGRWRPYLLGIAFLACGVRFFFLTSGLPLVFMLYAAALLLLMTATDFEQYCLFDEMMIPFDTYGHDAGDLRLKEIADIMKEIFDLDDIYRLGGDEFIIIMDNVKKLDKMDKLRKFKKVIRNRSVDVAIGFEWVENASEFDFGMKSADKKMYRNKKKYYKTHKLTERGDERAAAR